MTLPPPGFVIGSMLSKAAVDHGFRVALGLVEGHPGWLSFSSPSVVGRLFLSAESEHGPWLLAPSRPDVARDLGADGPGGPGVGTLILPDLSALREAIDRAWHLSRATPTPLAAFEAATQGLPRATEAERLVVQRIGQDLFRDRLLAEWGCCPLTGIAEPALLRASHILPWAACASDAERLDPDNGLLLSALWDSAFDRLLVSFDERGRAVLSPHLSMAARAALGSPDAISLSPGRRARLTRHRERCVAAWGSTEGWFEQSDAQPSD